MIYNKKAQSQIITSVLIILLVLAAVVIVWQVVNNTVTEAGDQIGQQTACLGLTLEATQVSDTVVNVKRGGSGDTYSSAEVIVLSDGGRLVKTASPDVGQFDTVSKSFTDPLGSVEVTFGDEVDVIGKELEFGIIADGGTCTLTAKLTGVDMAP